MASSSDALTSGSPASSRDARRAPVSNRSRAETFSAPFSIGVGVLEDVDQEGQRLPRLVALALGAVALLEEAAQERRDHDQGRGGQRATASRWRRTNRLPR